MSLPDAPRPGQTPKDAKDYRAPTPTDPAQVLVNMFETTSRVGQLGGQLGRAQLTSIANEFVEQVRLEEAQRYEPLLREEASALRDQAQKMGIKDGYQKTPVYGEEGRRQRELIRRASELESAMHRRRR